MGLRNILIEATEFAPGEMRMIRQDSPGLSLKDVEALRKVLPPESVLCGKKFLRSPLIASSFGNSDSRVLGVDSLYPLVGNLEVLEGSFFFPVDEANYQQVCVIGTTARRKLFGVNKVVGEKIKINQEWFTVIGVLADRMAGPEEFEGVRIDNPNNDVYIPLSTLLKKFEQDPVDNQLDRIIVQLPEDANPGEKAALISGLIASTHRHVDDFSLIVPERLLEQNRRTRRIFNIVMGAIASISLVVGGIGIMNIMLASVLERTNEIGLRRALGARRRDIGRQFLMEALTISLGGALLGILLGYGISHVVAGYAGWSTTIQPSAILLGVGISSATGIVFGIYPARQAARVPPIEALRYE
jgi:putative ABC transport system permease protein